MKKDLKVAKIKKVYTKEEIRKKLMNILNNVKMDIEYYHLHYSVFTKDAAIGREAQKTLLEFILKKYFKGVDK